MELSVAHGALLRGVWSYILTLSLVVEDCGGNKNKSYLVRSLRPMHDQIHKESGTNLGT
jgi:hypothetical protein